MLAHRDYGLWLETVGEYFSPMFPFRRPLRFGRWASWTVEAYIKGNQGLKLFALQNHG